MSLAFSYKDGVNPDLKNEITYFGKWLRQNYVFTKPLEIRLIHVHEIIDFDGVKCAIRWWQCSNENESVKGEVAVKSFDENLENDGPSVAYPTVIASISRVIKYYFLAIQNLPENEDSVTEWGDNVMSAYIDKIAPPPIN
ncbi:MAG: hypothetical protein HRT37_16310 [Alteromonadaceae bacterium]|nr:hypothetical protein [Alteromonadaceae bacterium]